MYWMTFRWPLPKVMNVASINKNFLICTIEWEPLLRSLQNVVTVSLKWCFFPDNIFVKSCWKRLFWSFVPQKFRMCLSRSKTTLPISQKWMVQFTRKDVEVHLLDARQTIWPWPLTWSMTLTLDFSLSNFGIAVSYELLVWLMSSGKEVNQLNNRMTIWPCPLTTLMNLTLKFQGQILK